MEEEVNSGIYLKLIEVFKFGERLLRGKIKRAAKVFMHQSGPNHNPNLSLEVQIMAVEEFTTQELESEEWRNVVGYEGFYQVSSLGRVKRIKAGQSTRVGYILKPALCKAGYFMAALSRDGKPVWHLVHRLVAKAFIEPASNAQSEVNHINAVKTNNRSRNLEYCTPSENRHHAATLGLVKFTLPDDVVRLIRTSREKGTVLAHRFNISESHVSHIKKRLKRRNVSD